MNITEIFIRRPVMTTLVMLGIVLFGLAGYRALPVSDLPNVDLPTLLVTASLPGAPRAGAARETSSQPGRTKRNGQARTGAEPGNMRTAMRAATIQPSAITAPRTRSADGPDRPVALESCTQKAQWPITNSVVNAASSRTDKVASAPPTPGRRPSEPPATNRGKTPNR